MFKRAAPLWWIWVLVIFTAGCLPDDCPDCFSPPPAFALMVRDSISGENLLKPGAFNPDSIRMYYLKEDVETDLQFELYGDDNNRFIYAYNMGYVSAAGYKTFLLYLNDQVTDTIYMDVAVKSDVCCTWHELNQLEIGGVQPDFNQEYLCWMIYR